MSFLDISNFSNSISDAKFIKENFVDYLKKQEELDRHLCVILQLNNIQKVEYCWYLLFESGNLPHFNKLDSKSSEVSEKYRLLGNHAFAKKKDLLAIRNYTLAAGYAPVGSKEFVLAIANRSAVTSSLNEHHHCINDINYSLKKNYPANLKYKLLERKGKSLVYLSQYKEASIVLKSALVSLSGSGLDADRLKQEESKISKLLESCNSSNIENETSLKENYVLPEVSYGFNEFIEGASSAIEIVYSKEMGRHLVATRDINPGDVLALEKPYTSVLLPESYGLFCHYCLRRSHSLIPCNNCSLAYFCSEECHEKAVLTYHRVECNLFGLLLALGCDKLELLAVRTLVTASHQGSDWDHLAEAIKITLKENIPHELKGFLNGRYSSTNYTTVHHLEGNSNLRSAQDLFSRALISALLIQALDDTSSFFQDSFKTEDCLDISDINEGQTYNDLDSFANEINQEGIMCKSKRLGGGLLLKYLQIMPCNAHEVSEMLVKNGQSESVEMGGALYPLLSLTNHSCDPNVVRHSYCGDAVALTAIQLIKKGEQIYDNYGYHHAVHSPEERYKHLWNQYYFKCNCPACYNNWPLYPSMPSSNPQYLEGAEISKIAENALKFEKVLKELMEGKKKDELLFLYSYLKLMHEGIKRPWKEYSMCQEAIKQCLSLQANHYSTQESDPFTCCNYCLHNAAIQPLK